MVTMLSGAAIMDGAILMVAANEPCPQPQTKEHLIALGIMGVKSIIIVQNKIDLVTSEQALSNYKQIKAFIHGTIAEHAPIIPISAQHDVNIDVLLEVIQEMKTPSRDKDKDPLFFIARSFDINKPGTKIKDIHGGVLGGALKQGILKLDEEIEIRPGLRKEFQGRTTWEPIHTIIENLMSGGTSIKELVPGGSAGILTKLDPRLVKADSLTGNLVGLKGKLPQTYYEFTLKPKLLERIVGAKDEVLVEAVKKGELLMLNVNSAATIGTVIELKKDLIHVKLRIPVCCDIKDRITISRRLGTRWRLIGYAEIVK